MIPDLNNKEIVKINFVKYYLNAAVLPFAFVFVTVAAAVVVVPEVTAAAAAFFVFYVVTSSAPPLDEFGIIT